MVRPPSSLVRPGTVTVVLVVYVPGWGTSNISSLEPSTICLVLWSFILMFDIPDK